MAKLRATVMHSVKCKPKFTFVSEQVISAVMGSANKPFLSADKSSTIYAINHSVTSSAFVGVSVHIRVSPLLWSSTTLVTLVNRGCGDGCSHLSGWLWPNLNTTAMSQKCKHIPCLVSLSLFSCEQLDEVYQFKGKVDAIAIIKPPFPTKSFVQPCHKIAISVPATKKSENCTTMRASLPEYNLCWKFCCNKFFVLLILQTKTIVLVGN